MSNQECRELPGRSEQPGSSATSAAKKNYIATDVYGGIRTKKTTTGVCRKCGYPGHLPFQCYNFLQPSGRNCEDISSTSSESDYETPLTAKENKRKKRKSKEHTHHKHHRERKRSHSKSSTKRKRKKREKHPKLSPERSSNLKTKTETKRIDADEKSYAYATLLFLHYGTAALKEHLSDNVRN
uniref:CCHC-type domain-containing protein n=1 Tax=Elaeophora elaphi TaxID=1147741 RepID=A0A0R3RV93_9BILA